MQVFINVNIFWETGLTIFALQKESQLKPQLNFPFDRIDLMKGNSLL